MSRPTALGAAAPAPATNHTVRTLFRAIWIINDTFRLTFIIVFFPIPIAAPLPDIAMHVMQSPRIGGKHVNRNSVLPKQPFPIIVIRIVPVIVCLIGCYINTGIERRCGSCPASILPLCLRRQPKLFPCCYGTPLAVGISIIPTHMHDWMIILARFPLNT